MRYLLALVVGCVFGVGCGDSGSGPIDAPNEDVLPDQPIDMMIDAGPTSTDAGTDMSLLSMQGVYGNFSMRTLPVDAIAYTVNYELWADAATKRRWLILSPGSAPINSADPEDWQYPPGTRFVKEFARGTTLVETRILENIGTATVPTWSMRTFVWRTDQTDADLDLDGATDVAGTTHDAPSSGQCMTCHNGAANKILGFTPVQLPTSTLAMLSASGKLSTGSAGGPYGPTGAAAEVEALGYLHGNCMHCHNPVGIAFGSSNMNLRLDAASKAANQEPGYLTTVNIATVNMTYGTERIDGTNNANSSVRNRMDRRGQGQMPQIATEVIDTAGVAKIEAWIATLPP